VLLTENQLRQAIRATVDAKIKNPSLNEANFIMNFINKFRKATRRDASRAAQEIMQYLNQTHPDLGNEDWFDDGQAPTITGKGNFYIKFPEFLEELPFLHGFKTKADFDKCIKSMVYKAKESDGTPGFLEEFCSYVETILDRKSSWYEAAELWDDVYTAVRNDR
jgi:hypothetical protein